MIPLIMTIGIKTNAQTTQANMCFRLAQIAWMLDCIYMTKLSWLSISILSGQGPNQRRIYTQVLQLLEPYVSLKPGAVIAKYPSTVSTIPNDIYTRVVATKPALIAYQVSLGSNVGRDGFLYISVRGGSSADFSLMIAFQGSGIGFNPTNTTSGFTHFTNNQTVTVMMPDDAYLEVRAVDDASSKTRNFSKSDLTPNQRIHVKYNDDFPTRHFNFSIQPWITTPAAVVMPYPYVEAMHAENYINSEPAFQSLKQIDPCYLACYPDADERCAPYKSVTDSMTGIITNLLALSSVNYNILK
jgi:hypothetical protein